MPGIKVTGDDDDLVGLFAAGDLGDDVVHLHILANAVLVGELNRNGPLLEHALHQQHVFEAYLRYGIG